MVIGRDVVIWKCGKNWKRSSSSNRGSHGREGLVLRFMIMLRLSFNVKAWQMWMEKMTLNYYG